MDGTIVHNMPIHNQAWKETLAEAGVQIDMNEFHRTTFGKKLTKLCALCWGQSATKQIFCIGASARNCYIYVATLLRANQSDRRYQRHRAGHPKLSNCSEHDKSTPALQWFQTQLKPALYPRQHQKGAQYQITVWQYRAPCLSHIESQSYVVQRRSAYRPTDIQSLGTLPNVKVE